MTEDFKEEDLSLIIADLKRLEPLIYVANDGKMRDYFEDLLIPDFWEIGASGKKYDRDFILSILEDRNRNPREEPWYAFNFKVRQIENNHFLFTYSLQQPQRLSQRATLWRRTQEGWRMVYHQGTPVL